MADKRTAELGTMDISVAYVDGLIVVDSLTLQSADGEQQKVLISTLLEYFRNQGEDFYIGALNLSRITTTNNSTTDVMLLDGSGNVRIRNIGDLIQGTELVETDFIKVSNEISESPVQSATKQSQINEQINIVLTYLQDQIDNVTNLGATATIEADPTPQAQTTTEATITFSTLFDSTNENIILIDEADNTIELLVNGIFQLAIYMKISNSDSSATHTLTLRARDVDTDEILSETDIIVYKDGFSGTWLNRFGITSAPVNAYFTAQSSDASDLAIESAQVNIISLSAGVSDDFNNYIVNVFGQDDDTLDSTHLQDAVSSLTQNQILKLYGTFYLTSQIDFELLTGNVIDCSAAFLKFYRTDTNPICFNIKDSYNLKFINLNGSFEHASTSTNVYVLATEYNTVTPENLIIDGVQIPLIGGTVTNYALFYSPTDSDTIHINNVLGDYGQIYVYQNSIVENVYLSDSGSYIGADLACKILKCYVNTITVTDNNNNIVSNNFATTYNGNSGTNRFSNNIGLTGGGGSLDPADDVEITGNWYFSQNVGFGGISAPSEAVGIGGNLLLNTAAPYIDLYNSSGAVDLKYWRIINNSGRLIFRNLDDTQATDEDSLTLIASSGHVGIKTVPSYPLHVLGTIFGSGNYLGGYGTNTTTSANQILVNGRGFMGNSDNIGITNINETGNIIFCINGLHEANEKMRLTSDGFLGIGTTSPSYNLHLIGNLGVTGSVYDASTSSQMDINPYEKLRIGRSTNNSNFSLEICTGLSVTDPNHRFSGTKDSFTCLYNGNLGIGTTSPSYKLHVVGDIYATGNIIGATFEADDSSEPVTRSTGGIIYIESGALKYKGASGTVTTIAPA